MSVFSFQISPKVPILCKSVHRVIPIGLEQQSVLAFRSLNTKLFGQRFITKVCKIRVQGAFLSGSMVVHSKANQRNINNSKSFIVSASWLTSSAIASNAFTWTTISVLPFYTLMVFAPNATVTRRAMESNFPYVVLGLVYAFLLYLSWSPNTLRLMFASKYWLPELPGISKMFMNEMTLVSAWIHLLAVDLYAARFFRDNWGDALLQIHFLRLYLGILLLKRNRKRALQKEEEMEETWKLG